MNPLCPSRGLSQLLDYKHNHPQLIENCTSLLIKIFSNILENPHEDKFRQVRAELIFFLDSGRRAQGSMDE